MSKQPKADAFYYVDDVQKLLGVSVSKAYKEIQKLNEKLEEMGYMHFAGRIPKQFFHERFYGSLIPPESNNGGEASGM